MNYLLPNRLDGLAREFALGTLSRGAQRRFMRVVAESGVAARAVTEWQERLAQLLPYTAVMQPRPETFLQLQQHLFGMDAEVTAESTGQRSTPQLRRMPRTGGHAPAMDTEHGHFGAMLRLLAHRLPGLAIGAAMCMAVVAWQPRWLGVEPADGKMPPSYVGVLDDVQGRSMLVTSARRHGRTLTVRLLRPVPLVAGQTLQLWAWNDSTDTQPVPVVQWTAPGTVTLELQAEAEKILGRMTHLGVSIESTTARPATPSEPFIARGHCGKLW